MFDHKLVTFCPNTGCWLWRGGVSKDGYGAVNRFGQNSAHRASYVENVGGIPKGLEIDHLCKQRCCVNPDHLEAVTHAENVRRGDYVSNHRNRRKTHCKRGHKLSGDNLRIAANGSRQCRACIRAKDKARDYKLSDDQLERKRARNREYMRQKRARSR